jgi:hypothetical protein
MKQKAIRIPPWAPPELSFGEMAAVTIGGLFMLSLGPGRSSGPPRSPTLSRSLTTGTCYTMWERSRSVSGRRCCSR